MIEKIIHFLDIFFVVLAGLLLIVKILNFFELFKKGGG